MQTPLSMDCTHAHDPERPRRFLARDGQSYWIRPARATDRQPLIANINSIAAEGLHLQTDAYVPDAAWETALQFSHDRVSGSLLLVACTDGQLIGHARVFAGAYGPKDRHVGTIGVALLAPYRGIGLGSALLQGALAWAPLAGFAKLEAFIVGSNARSIRLFAARGFEVEAVRRAQLRIHGTDVDEVVMVCYCDAPSRGGYQSLAADQVSESIHD